MFTLSPATALARAVASVTGVDVLVDVAQVVPPEVETYRSVIAISHQKFPVTL